MNAIQVIGNGESVDWVSTLLVSTVPALLAAVVSLAGMYFKHRLDMEEYRKVSNKVERVTSKVDAVDHKLENGIKTTLQDTNRKVDELISVTNKEGC